MLILISINVQYLQNIVFSFEKGPNGQNQYSSDSHNHLKKIPPDNFLQMLKNVHNIHRYK